MHGKQHSGQRNEQSGEAHGQVNRNIGQTFRADGDISPVFLYGLFVFCQAGKAQCLTVENDTDIMKSDNVNVYVQIIPTKLQKGRHGG